MSCDEIHVFLFKTIDNWPCQKLHIIHYSMCIEKIGTLTCHCCILSQSRYNAFTKSLNQVIILGYCLFCFCFDYCLTSR